MNKPIKLLTQGLTFERGAVLYASQLTNLRDKIDEVIDFLPASFALTQPTTTEPTTTNPTTGPSEQDIVNWINDAKAELNDRIAIIEGIINQYGDGHTYVRTDDEMIELFKTPFKSLLVHYGITDSNGNPFFNLFLEKNGITPAMISAWINKDSSTSNIGISADYIIVGGDTTLTGKLTAMDAEMQTLTVNNEANIKKVVSEMIETELITVTGDLHYRRIIGKVQDIQEENGLIDSDTSYVRCRAKLIRLPDPATCVTGQTIYVETVDSLNSNILPSSGTALLAGLVYVGSYEVGVGNGSDTDNYYKYRWALVEYDSKTGLKLYNTKLPYVYDVYSNLKGTILHSYMYTGSLWVETTALPEITANLSLYEKQRLGL